jgi:hypothetical protein
MGDAKKKPGVAFCATVVVIVVLLTPVLYVGSLWPTIRWIVNRPLAKGNELAFVTRDGRRELPPSAPRLYWPIGWVAKHGNRSLRSAIIWCATSNYDQLVYLPTDRNGKYELVLRGE